MVELSVVEVPPECTPQWPSAPGWTVGKLSVEPQVAGRLHSPMAVEEEVGLQTAC